MSPKVTGSRSMYSVRIPEEMSSPSLSAFLIWHRKYCEKYDGAIVRARISGTLLCQQSPCTMRHDSYSPSDEMDAPESLNSSPPICIGNTRSRGRMSGILCIVDSVWLLSLAAAGVEEAIMPARTAWPASGFVDTGSEDQRPKRIVACRSVVLSLNFR